MQSSQWTAFQLSELVEATTCWLHFEASCGHSRMFEEKVLIQPIFQFLNHRYPGQVSTNVKHPILRNKEKIDFVVRAPGTSEWLLAIETKWLKRSSPRSEESLIRMVQDMIRLELVARIHGCRHACLILAGSGELFADFWYRNRRSESAGVARDIATQILPSTRQRPFCTRFNDTSLTRPIFAQASKKFASFETRSDFFLEPSIPFRKKLCTTCEGCSECQWRPYDGPRQNWAAYGWSIIPTIPE